MSKEITLEITSVCPFGCKWCSTNASEDGVHLSYGSILDFLNNITEKFDVERINISGGEPLLHPNFVGVLAKCYTITSNVWVYTNLIRNIIYNSKVVKEIQVHANVCVAPGEDIYIPKGADKVHLLKLVRQGRAKDWKDVPVKVSKNFEMSTGSCEDCNHILLQADGKVVEAPCKKSYD